MITETTYTPSDLRSGKCTSCSETSEEILIGDGRCIGCIEAINFENSCMRNEPDFDDEPSFNPCASCDRPDACEDFGCAIKQGLATNNY